MTVPIEVANVRSENIVSELSRYRKKRIIYWGEQRKLTFETYVRKPYVPNGTERVMLITPGLEYRPDLMAYDVYGTPDVWWRIMEINALFDVWDFKAGLTVMLPDNIF